MLNKPHIGIYEHSTKVVSIDIVAVLYFIYDNETLILGETILQSCKPWFCMLFGFFSIEFEKSQLDTAKAEGQTS